MTLIDPPQIVDLAPTTTAVRRRVVPMDQLASFFDESFGTIASVLADQGVVPTGAAFARYAGPPAEVVDLEVGFPTDLPVAPSDGVDVGELPGGRVATAVHAGSFDGLGDAWGELMDWVASSGEQPAGPLWEVYVTEPSPDMDPADLRTELYVLLA